MRPGARLASNAGSNPIAGLNLPFAKLGARYTLEVRTGPPALRRPGRVKRSPMSPKQSRADFWRAGGSDRRSRGAVSARCRTVMAPHKMPVRRNWRYPARIRLGLPELRSDKRLG